MHFRLWTLLYVFALVAAAMATFGGGGIVVAAVMLIGWSVLLNPKSSNSQRMMSLLVYLGIVVLLIGLLLPEFRAARESSRRAAAARQSSRSAACRNNLKQLAVALLTYDEQNGQLPPAIVYGESGAPHHSWRTAIFPFSNYESLYKQYRLDEPWNGPRNRLHVKQSLDFYQCPSDPPAALGTSQTNYYAVIGDNTVWPEDHAFVLKDMTDDPSETIMLIETTGLGTQWAEPVDLTFDQALEILTGARNSAAVHQYVRWDVGFFQKCIDEAAEGIHVALADGDVRFLPLPIPHETAVALLTASGGEQIDDAPWLPAEPQLDFATIYGFAVFVILALLPAYRLVRPGAP